MKYSHTHTHTHTHTNVYIQPTTPRIYSFIRLSSICWWVRSSRGTVWWWYNVYIYIYIERIERRGARVELDSTPSASYDLIEEKWSLSAADTVPAITANWPGGWERFGGSSRCIHIKVYTIYTHTHIYIGEAEKSLDGLVIVLTSLRWPTSV